MWQSIRDVLTSPNATIILCFILFVLLIGIIMSKSGLMTIYTSAVQIGTADKERNILRQQIDYIRLHCQSLENSMVKPEGYDGWRGKFIISRAAEEYIDWVTFNHISSASGYIDVKTEKMVDLINSLTVKEEFKTEEFQEFIRKDVRDTIQKLIQIRNIYK